MIKDSGERRQFDTGAVRDMQEGKGRCDLLPLDVVSDILKTRNKRDLVLEFIQNFTETGNFETLETLVFHFSDITFKGIENMLLELSVHFEEGAKKYTENNWKLGIETKCYIDSAIRHYLKYKRGDNDERHDRAFMWNIVCCIWTCKHKPELNSYNK